ncbi:MAG: plasmid recombination protein [Oscillospiraceae bacterium]|nr:plasmid recombination protein [Oscillospiraceae bacterium]
MSPTKFNTKGAIPIEKRTISGRISKKHSLPHNNREFLCENVDPTRTKDNITLIKDDIGQVYHELFDNALAEYNSKQKRKDRIIKDYHEHIRHSRQEQEYHEVIFQIGNQDDTPVGSDMGKVATELLRKFAENFQTRNPHLRVFNAVIHLDEATPHIHIDFIPFATEQKRGLSTRVSLTKALEQQGFKGEGKFNTACKLWIDNEKEVLAQLMRSRNIEWEQLGTHNEHLSVLDFKKQQRTKEVARLENKIECTDKQLQHRQELLNEVEDTIDRLDSEYQEKKEAVGQLDEDIAEKEATLAESNALLATAAKKTSKIKDIDDIQVKKTMFGGNISVAPDDFKKLTDLAKKQIAAESKEKELNGKIATLKSEKEELTEQNIKLEKENAALKQENSSLKSVREKLTIASLQKEISEWKNKYQKVLNFIEKLNLTKQLQEFLKPRKHTLNR